MKMHEPIADAIYAPLLVRVSLGSYFILAGLSKLRNVHAFVEEVKKFNILPDLGSTLYGILLPYVEIGAGCLLIIGIWTTLASIVASLLLISFVYALGFFPNGGNLFNKDLILLCGAISLMYSGAGAFSVDRFRKT